jgi:hypothetical protein
MIDLDFSTIQLKLAEKEGKTCVFDPIRRKWIILTPEEHVRQFIIAFLTDSMHYPTALMAVEKTLKVGAMNKRFDIVIYDRDHKPWMLIECKEPGVPVTEKTLHQLLNYQRTLQCNYWLLSNGHQTYCADACDPSNIKWLAALPAFAQ